MTTFRALAASATGCSDIRSITMEESFSQITASCIVECDTTTASLGDAISVGLGYDTPTNIFSGYITKIERQRPDNIIRITAFDELIKAVNYFIAADDPEAPFQRNNITSLALITDLLALASITSVTSTEPSPSFSWGTNEDGARFNLQSVADAIGFIANITGGAIWWDASAGRVEYQYRKPYVDAGDTPLATWTTANTAISDITYHRGTEKTRNVVKIYGKSPLTASASASNPYLVVDQAIIIAHELLDTQQICNDTATVNLALLNRLDEKIELTREGDPTIRARQIYRIEENFTGFSDDVFLYRVSHMLNDSGFYTSVTAIP